jgi:hypothetical protein
MSSNTSSFSDNRINNIVGISNGKEDSEKLKKIEITRYL